MTFDGERKIKTTFGAGVSLVFFMIVFSYGVYRITLLFNKWNPAISKTSMVRNLNTDGPYTPSDYGFDFAFGIYNDLDPSIGYFTVRHLQ
jgi:hypothetical protein